MEILTFSSNSLNMCHLPKGVSAASTAANTNWVQRVRCVWLCLCECVGKMESFSEPKINHNWLPVLLIYHRAATGAGTECRRLSSWFSLMVPRPEAGDLQSMSGQTAKINERILHWTAKIADGTKM